MAKTHYIKVNVSTGVLTDWADQPLGDLKLIRGDDELFAFWFVELFVSAGDSVEQNLDLTAMTVFRVDIDDKQEDDSPTDLAFQDVYNQLSNATLENLSEGKVTAEVSLTDAAVQTFLGVQASALAFLEIATVIDSKNKTLLQTSIVIEQDANNGSDTPSTPAGTFYTDTETHTYFLEIDQTDNTATETLTIKQGLHQVRCTGATTRTVSLPDATTYDTTVKQQAIVEVENLGGAAITIDDDGGANILTAQSPAGVASVSLPIQFTYARFRSDGTNWYQLTPSF
jgi:hypothetical protein